MYVGRLPMAMVDIAMNTMEISRQRLRPMVSPMWPKMMPPRGLRGVEGGGRGVLAHKATTSGCAGGCRVQGAGSRGRGGPGALVPAPDDKCGRIDAPERQRLDGLIVCREEHTLKRRVQLRVTEEVKPAQGGGPPPPPPPPPHLAHADHVACEAGGMRVQGQRTVQGCRRASPLPPNRPDDAYAAHSPQIKLNIYATAQHARRRAATVAMWRLPNE